MSRRARARTRASRGPRPCADWRAALACDDLDAVVVTLPTALHAEVALASIARGVAMYLEKPLASTLEEATAVRDAWRATGAHGRRRVQLAVPSPARAVASTGAASGASATSRLMRCAFTVAARYDGSWRHHSAEGGGVLYDLASHQVDLARYLLGREIVRVSAARATSADGETLAVTGEIDGGVLLSATWASGAIDDEVVEVVGTEGAVRLARYEDLTVTRRGRSVPGAAARLTRALPTPRAVAFGLARRRSPWHDPSFAAALDNFVRAARSGDAVVPGVDEGWHSARAIDAIAEAIRTGRTVAL